MSRCNEDVNVMSNNEVYCHVIIGLTYFLERSTPHRYNPKALILNRLLRMIWLDVRKAFKSLFYLILITVVIHLTHLFPI